MGVIIWNSTARILIFFLIFFRHIIFWKLPGPHFAAVGVTRVLNAADGFGLRILPFFHQFFYTFGIVITLA